MCWYLMMNEAAFDERCSFCLHIIVTFMNVIFVALTELEYEKKKQR